MAIWVMLAMWVATLVISELTRPKPEDNLKPQGLGDFNFPTATEGRPIPVVFGYNRLKAPNLVWYGDYQAEAIKESVKTGLFSSDKITVGYKYKVGMQFVLCHDGVGEITRIGWGEVELWTGSAMNETIHVDKKNVFGGEDEGGGIQSYFEILDGNSAQTANAYLEAQIGATLPAYRGVTSVIMVGPSGKASYGGLETGYLGTSPQIDAISFDVKRYPDYLDTLYTNTYSVIGTDANPVECLLEIMMSDEFGSDLESSDINLTNFRDAAQTVYNEGNGFSMVWDRRGPIKDVIDIILEQIDAILYVNPTTGLFELKLARADYDLGTVPVFDESNVLKMESFSRGSWDETSNEIVLVYPDSGDGFNDKAVDAQELANWRIQGSIVSSELKMPGVRTATNAGNIAVREVKARSYPLAKCSLLTNRDASTLLPGEVFKWNWPELGITDMPMRVIKVGYGDLVGGQCRIDAIQDVFGLSTATFTGPQPSGWLPIIPDTPTAATKALWMESFYWANAAYGDADPEVAQGILSVERPAGDTLDFTVEDYLLYSRNTWETAGDLDPWDEWGAWGQLDAAYPKDTAGVDTTTSLVINPGSGLDRISSKTWAEIQTGENLMKVNDEIMAFETVVLNADGTITISNIYRGLFDTIPEAHSATDEVWFLSLGAFKLPGNHPDVVTTEYLPANVENKVRIAARSPRGVADWFYTGFFYAVDRAALPYPPGDFEVNALRYPPTMEGRDDTVYTWAHRDRITEDTAVTRDTDAGIGPETNVTYTLKLYDVEDSMALIRTETGLTGESYTYDDLTEKTDAGISDSIEVLAGAATGNNLAQTLYRMHPDVLLRFNEGASATVIQDWSGNGNKCTKVSGDQVMESVTAIRNGDGLYGQFTSASEVANQRWNIADTAAIRGQGGCTILAVCTFTHHATQAQRLVDKQLGGSQWPGYTIYLNTTDILETRWYKTNANDYVAATADVSAYLDGKNHTVIVTFDGAGDKKARIYVDNVLLATSTASATDIWASTSPVTVGGIGISTGTYYQHWRGKIGLLGLWSGYAAAQADVTYLYDAIRANPVQEIFHHTARGFDARYSNTSVTITRNRHKWDQAAAPAVASSHTVQATFGRNARRCQFEYKMIDLAGTGVVGVSDGNVVLTGNYLGQNVANMDDSCGIDIATSTIYSRIGGTYTTHALTTALVINDVITVLCDFDAETISFYKNGTYINQVSWAGDVVNPVWYPTATLQSSQTIYLNVDDLEYPVGGAIWWGDDTYDQNTGWDVVRFDTANITIDPDGDNELEIEGTHATNWATAQGAVTFRNNMNGFVMSWTFDSTTDCVMGACTEAYSLTATTHLGDNTSGEASIGLLPSGTIYWKFNTDTGSEAITALTVGDVVTLYAIVSGTTRTFRFYVNGTAVGTTRDWNTDLTDPVWRYAASCKNNGRVVMHTGDALPLWLNRGCPRCGHLTTASPSGWGINYHTYGYIGLVPGTNYTYHSPSNTSWNSLGLGGMRRSGRWYIEWENTYNNASGGSSMYGLIGRRYPIEGYNTYPGNVNTGNAIGFQNAGGAILYDLATRSTTTYNGGVSLVDGDRLGLAVDFEAKTVGVYVNGVWDRDFDWGAIDNIGEIEFYPSVHCHNGGYSGDPDRVTIFASNDNPPLYPPPAGFRLWREGDCIQRGHKYWRIYVHNCVAGATAWHMDDLFIHYSGQCSRDQLGAGSSTNNATYSASSLTAGYTAKGACDWWTGHWSYAFRTAANQTTDQWWKMTSPDPIAWTGFSLTATTLAPKDFEIQWSDDDLNWTTAASYTDVTNWKAGAYMYFAVDNPLHGADDQGGGGNLRDIQAPKVNELRATLETVRSTPAGTALKVYDHSVERLGYGYRWGEYYGGES